MSTDNIGDQEGGRLQSPYLDNHWKHTGRTLIVSPAQSCSMEGKSQLLNNQIKYIELLEVITLRPSVYPC